MEQEKKYEKISRDELMKKLGYTEEHVHIDHDLSAGALYDLEKHFPEKIIKKHKCPVCSSTDIEDTSTFESNGIFGPGHSSWKVSDTRCCNDCGVMFKPTEKNTLPDD